jgi:hypothetical protein
MITRFLDKSGKLTSEGTSYWDAVGIDWDVIRKHENPVYRNWDGQYVLSGMK